MIIRSRSKTKNFSIKCEGDSMLPILRSGDLLYFKRTIFGKLKVNDIVLVKINKSLVTHRIIFVAKKSIITKGDDNYYSDGNISPKNVIAKLDCVKRSAHVFDPENLYLFQSILYLKEINIIKGIFKKKMVDFVFLKGLPLHLFYEKTHPRRIYFDCDVLVSKVAFKKIGSVFTKFGYKKYDPFIKKNLPFKEMEVSFYKEYPNGFSVMFDVHQKINFMTTPLNQFGALYPQDLADKLTEDFLINKRLVRINKSCFPILSFDHLIIYLAIHFFNHNFRGVFRLTFIDKIIKNKKISNVFWQKLALKIKSYQVQNFVYPVFLLLIKYFNSPIPDSFLKKIKPGLLSRIYINKVVLKTNIFNGEQQVEESLNRFNNSFLLSPQPIFKKLLALINPKISQHVLKSLWREILPKNTSA